MKSSLVSFAAYLAVILVVGAAIYFFAFLRPNANRIEALERDIEAARIELVDAASRDELYEHLSEDLRRLQAEREYVEGTYRSITDEWRNHYEGFLPYTFDEWDISHRIESIVRPHSDTLNVEFSYSVPLSTMHYNEDNPEGLPEGIWLTPVNVTFLADNNGLNSVLDGFAHAGIDNRIINYTLNRYSNAWNVTIRLDILTQTPHPYRFNGNYVVVEE